MSDATSTPELKYFLEKTLPDYIRTMESCETHVSHLYPRQAKVGVQCGEKAAIVDKFIAPSEMDAKTFANIVRGTLHSRMIRSGFKFEQAINRENRLYSKQN